MKILITHSYFFHFDSKQLLQSKPYPPLATLIAAAVLRNEKHQLYFYDVSFEEDLNGFKQKILDFNPDVLVIYEDGFNYLTKMCLTNMRDASMAMAAFAQGRKIKVVVSGSDSTDQYALYLNKNVDIVLIGEAEESLKEVIQRLGEGQSLSKVKGIAYRENENIVVTEKRVVNTMLDALPFAAWELLDIKPYQQAWKKHGYFSVNMATTRGCPFKCNWCAKPIYGNRYNVRTPGHVVSELVVMKQHFSFDHVWFCDDIFGLKPGWVAEFSEVLLRNNIKIQYKIQARVDLLLKENTLEVLAKSGAGEIWVGAESGSQKILDAMDKGTTVEQIYEATQKMKRAGLKPCFFLQFGYPGETKQDIKQTLEMVFDLMPSDIGVSVSYPLPGTKFYEQVKDELHAKSNWKDSDELLLMYAGTYSAPFYKALHRYVHKRFRAKQARQELQNLFTAHSISFLRALAYFYFSVAAGIEKTKMHYYSKHVLT